MRPYTDEKRHSISLHVPNVPLWMKVDPLRLEQIMTNLLKNAAKYTNEGGQITVTATLNNQTVIITVADNGIGISPSLLSKIFEPFVQAHTPDNSSAGLGIGLSLVKDLVELHGGTIEAHSMGPATGSEFVITMPSNVRREEVPKKSLIAPYTVAPDTAHKKADTSKKHKILVVDDNDAAAEVLGELLSRKGHNVVLARCGKEAVEKASAFNPDVVVLDIGLPDIDGYEVLRLIHKKMKRIATFIAITGYGQQQDKIKAKNAGFDYHLTKPIRVIDLENILGTIRLKIA